MCPHSSELHKPPLLCHTAHQRAARHARPSSHCDLLHAEAAKASCKWHPLAARLAGVTGTSDLTLPGNSATDLAACVQQVTCKLGRISDLVQELADLRLAIPALADAQVADKAVQLTFLGLDSELKFSVLLALGGQLSTWLLHWCCDL